MDCDRLYQILGDTTVQLRKGEEVRSEGGVTTIDAMPHVAEAKPDLEKIDLEFLVVGVDRAAAEQHKAELISILKTYPRPERLAHGPSYIEVGSEVEDQGAAFQLFALGKVLGLWDVVTPATLGVTGINATILAGSGLVMITGFNAGGKDGGK